MLWDGSNASIENFGLYIWDPSHAPVNITFVESPQHGSGGSGGGSGFPADKLDHAFVSESGPTYATGPQARGKRIVEFAPDAADELGAAPTTLVEYSGTGKATVAGLAAASDGLYFTDLYKDQDAASPIDPGANLLRVSYLAPPAPAPAANSPASCPHDAPNIVVGTDAGESLFGTSAADGDSRRGWR